MEIDEQKARVVQAVVGLGIFPKSTIYKEFYDMTEEQIQQMQEELKKEKEEEAADQQGEAEQQSGLDQQNKDKDMDREQKGKDADADRDEGSKQADAERQMEVEKAKPKKESIDPKTHAALARLKKKIISESGSGSTKTKALDRVMNRNVRNPQNNI